jgi:hypothetical protein
MLAPGPETVTGPAGTGRMRLPGPVRGERTLALFALASRTAYCGYCAATVVLNIADYQRPGLAAAALLLALLVSVGLGVQVWRAQTVSGGVALLDTGVAAVVLVLVAAAIRTPDQAGSRNWALAYAVAAATWLAFGRGLRWRAGLACALGAVYGVTVLIPVAAPSAALIITAVVNAASPPMYFGIAAAFSWVLHRIAAEMAAEHALEQRQQRDLAALGERERLVGQVHRSVLATLEEIASGHATWEELRGRARTEVMALRGAFSEPDGSRARDGLRARLTAVAAGRAGAGWRVELIDEELETEPPAVVTQALCDALAELIAGPAPGGPVRAQVLADGSRAEVLVRMPGDEPALAAAIARAGARLAEVAGTAEPAPALRGEVRMRLWSPA